MRLWERIHEDFEEFMRLWERICKDLQDFVGGDFGMRICKDSQDFGKEFARIRKTLGEDL